MATELSPCCYRSRKQHWKIISIMLILGYFDSYFDSYHLYIGIFPIICSVIHGDTIKVTTRGLCCTIFMSYICIWHAGGGLENSRHFLWTPNLLWSQEKTCQESHGQDWIDAILSLLHAGAPFQNGPRNLCYASATIVFLDTRAICHLIAHL